MNFRPTFCALLAFDPLREPMSETAQEPTRRVAAGDSPRTRARRLAPEARRAQLLGCAIGVFARRGLDAARHAEIARAGGVSVPTVFAYFPNRRALVEAVLAEVRRFYVDLARRIHDSSRGAPERILEHTRAFADSVDARPDYARVWLAWSAAVCGDTWPRYLELEEEIVAILARTLERGQHAGTIGRAIAPEDGARIAIGAATMIAQMKLSGRNPETVVRFEEALVRALAGGLAAR
jgi:TetR/AcrR family hemagglutinin/protease transcriptional regulator